MVDGWLQNDGQRYIRPQGGTPPRLTDGEMLTLLLAHQLAYAHWRAQGGHTAKLGIKNFRLLTVTKSEARMRNTTLNQDGDPVMVMVVTMIVPRRPS